MACPAGSPPRRAGRGSWWRRPTESPTRAPRTSSPSSAATPGSAWSSRPASISSPTRATTPGEGTRGIVRARAEEVATEGARRVYEAYERRVREVAQGSLVFYAEIHGNSHPDAANRIEIATVGVDRAGAERLRTLCELIRDAHLRADRAAPRLALVSPTA